MKPAVFQPTLAQYSVTYIVSPEFEKTCGGCSWNRTHRPVVGLGKWSDDSFSQWEPCVLNEAGEIMLAKSLPNFEKVSP